MILRKQHLPYPNAQNGKCDDDEDKMVAQHIGEKPGKANLEHDSGCCQQEYY